MSKQRSLKPKADLNVVVEEQTLATPVCEGTDPETLPFPEFSDQDLNAEKWDLSALVKDKAIPNQQRILFEDNQKVHLPPGNAVHQWKRCSEVFSNANLVVFTQISEYPDLVTPNKHLLDNEFYRNFISGIETLLYIGCTKPFPTEYENSGFSAAGSRSWRPWYHIYSNCKIIKGEHVPVFNPSGKYVVRLFWLGTWRKIYVDDMVPLDNSDNILLPSLHIPKPPSTEDIHSEKAVKIKTKGSSPVRKETIELWPIILCKALLKIGSLSLCRMKKFNDFDIINCLTGWVPQRIKTRDISSGNLWDIFMAYVERFEWVDYKEGSTKKTGSTKTKSKGKDIPDTPKKGAKGVIPIGIETMRDGDRFVILSCDSFEPMDENEAVNKMIPIYVSQVRDIPVIKPPPRPELEFWKTFRYEEWAVEQGIIPPDIKKLNIQSLQIIDPFKRIMQAPEPVDESGNKILTSQELDNTDKKSEKSSKSSKKPPKGGKTVYLEPDPSMWIDFKDIQATVNQLTIYFQPRGFKSKTVITDLNFNNQPAEFGHVISPYALKKTRNEPIYMFLDSIDYKFLVINLAQMGDTSMLEGTNEEEEVEVVEKEDDLDICEEIVLKKTKNKDGSVTSSQMGSKNSVCQLTLQPVSVVLEEYSWEVNSLGQPRGMISTLATKSLIIDLKPGRVSFRLWLSSHCSYALQVFSDTPVTIGCLEEYLIASSMESQRLTNLCYELSSCYGKLVQSFGMPDYSVSLRNFYHCYKPFQHLSKRELARVHTIFFEEFCNLIEENSTTPLAVERVKLLFLQLKTFDYLNPYIEEPHLYPDKFPLGDQVEYAKLMQRSAVQVQAFFKRIYIRSVMKKLHEDHKQYYSIFDTLKKVYGEVFSSDKRLRYSPTLLRRFFERKEMRALNDKFELYHDLQSVLNLYVYNGTGTLTVTELSWVPMCRYEFLINSDESILIKINIFCNLKTYSIRVFDNDNLSEIKRINNNVVVEKYCRNTNGYTVLAYGWSKDLAKVNWKLVLATKKLSRGDLVIIPTTSMATQCLKGQYVPNFDNIISRHIIKVGSDSFLTAHLMTSYDQVRLSLRLLNKEGKILRQVSGVQSAVFPLLYLKCNEPKSESSAQLFETIQAQKKRISNLSGLSDITYNKLNKKYFMGEGRYSTVSRKSTIIDGDEAEGGTRRHRRKSSGESLDGDDEMSNSSLPNESSGKLYGARASKGSRPSLPTKSRSSSRAITSTSSNKVMECVHTEYILETKVVGNSWPLTADEWKCAQKIREKSYLNLNLMDDRRISTKKSTVAKKSTSLTLEEPYWVLDLVFKAGNPLEFEADRSMSEKRKVVKKKWFADVDRYKKGIELRRKFIEDNSVIKGNVIIIDKNARSNDPKEFATTVIVGENLEDYMIKPLEEVDEDSCKTKREDDYIIEEANIEHQMKAYAEDEYAIQEEIESQLQEQKENFKILSEWFEDVRNDSLEILTEALAMEKEYIHKVLQATTKGKSNKKAKEKQKK